MLQKNNMHDIILSLIFVLSTHNKQDSNTQFPTPFRLHKHKNGIGCGEDFVYKCNEHRWTFNNFISIHGLEDYNKCDLYAVKTRLNKKSKPSCWDFLYVWGSLERLA